MNILTLQSEPACNNHSHSTLITSSQLLTVPRMFEEFITAPIFDPDIEEDDIENLLIQQIEFALFSTLVLTKTILLLQSSLMSSRRLFEAWVKDAVIVEAVRHSNERVYQYGPSLT